MRAAARTDLARLFLRPTAARCLTRGREGEKREPRPSGKIPSVARPGKLSTGFHASDFSRPKRQNAIAPRAVWRSSENARQIDRGCQRRFTPNDNLIHRRPESEREEEGGRRDPGAQTRVSRSLSLSLSPAAGRVPLSRSGIWIKEAHSGGLPARRDTRGKRLSKAGINYLSLYRPLPYPPPPPPPRRAK
jgi:hypothetical protein